MKNIDGIIFFAMAAVMVACTRMPQINEDQEPEKDLIYMEFTAGVDSDVEPLVKTTYSGRKVYWEDDDAISIFFEGDEIMRQAFTVSSRSNDNQQAVFAGEGDPSASSCLAVYPYREADAYDGTELTVAIPTEQTAVANTFASGANVAVAYSVDKTGNLQFRNVGALLAFRFETAEDAAMTASVTFRARTAEEGKYHGIAGTAKVNVHESLPVVSGEGSSDHVTMHAPEGGFLSGNDKVYYVVVYPGEYQHGFDVSLTTNSSNPVDFSVTDDASGLLVRNSLLSMGELTNPYDFLPEEISIRLDFTSDVNPLGAFPKLADQKDDGDRFPYSYPYEWEGVSMTESMEFMITRGTSRSASAAGYYQHINFNNNYKTKQLYVVCNSGDTRIKLPAIRGRYLKSVSMSVQNTDNRRFRLQNQSLNRYVSSPWVKAATKDDKATTTISFPDTTSTFPTTTMGVGYIMELTDKANYNITDITVVYTKQPPVAE